MPDKITIYQKNIEAICGSDEEIKNRIKKVVRHEVAHFVGFTEEQVKWLGYWLLSSYHKYLYESWTAHFLMQNMKQFVRVLFVFRTTMDK